MYRTRLDHPRSRRSHQGPVCARGPAHTQAVGCVALVAHAGHEEDQVTGLKARATLRLRYLQYGGGLRREDEDHRLRVGLTSRCVLGPQADGVGPRWERTRTLDISIGIDCAADVEYATER